MIHTDEDLDHLSDLLDDMPLDQDGMTLAEFDGYVAGLLVCPELIMPSEWLPPVWGGEGVFQDTQQVEQVTQAVMDHYDRVARVLASDPDLYEPIYGADANSDDLLWEPWISGFEQAMRFRPDVWERIVQSDDEEATASVSMIIAMNQIDDGTSELTEGAIDEIDQIGPDLIPQMVRTLNSWTKSRHVGGKPQQDGPMFGLQTNVVPFRSKKVGRNEPCPCGSGRKYKRCCAAN
jgi:uncharacterized protein